jgi:anti-sigma factor RsiW
MVCGRVSNLLSAYLDRELTGAEMLSVRRHLSHCPACRAEHDAVARVRRLLGALPAVEPRAGSQERFLYELATGGRPSAWRIARRRPARVAGLSLLPPRKPAWALWAGAACAALAGGLLFTGLGHPRPPDAVVAMIRPQIESSETAADFNPQLTAYLWPDAGGEIRLGWQKRSEPESQLLGLRQGW